MTYYVCKQCNYKHTFLPLACAKCKGTNFYPLVTSEPTGNTSICKEMEIQEDVLKLRIGKEQLETENNKLLDVINNQDVKIADLEKQIEKMKNCGNCKYEYCGGSSISIDKDGNRTFHNWNKEKQEYCDVGKNGKYQCWELEEND